MMILLNGGAGCGKSSYAEALCDCLVVATNDVGSGAGDYDKGTRACIRAMGAINAALAREAETVVRLARGIPTAIKGRLPE